MDLLQNPFHILNASPRDNRQRIMELADERSLFLDSSECMQARSDLTNPRKRLSSEVAWLPGVGPKRAAEVLSIVEASPTDLFTLDRLSPIARANVLAAGLTRVRDLNANSVSKWILEIARAFERIVPEELRIAINEERFVSGFQEVTDLSAVEAEINERRRHYCQVAKSALDKLSPKELVEAVTTTVASATLDGKEHGPVLIVDLVNSYEVEAQGFLGKEEGSIKVLVEELRAAVDAKLQDHILAPMVNQLIHIVKNWDVVAQPIQVSAKSRGLDHDASSRIAILVRGLAIYMFNEHGKLEFSQQLTTMLQEVFAEIAKVAEITAEDADALGEIAERRKLSKLLDPISELCRLALENSEKNPASADREAQKIMSSAPQLIVNLSTSKPSPDILAQGNDEIAIALMGCAVIYGNKTEEWELCIAFLEEARKYASSQEVKERIQKNLTTVRNNNRLYGDLTPISSAPSLYTINGIGTTMYGSTDQDIASGSYLSTYYFVFLAIPIFPICRYRVIPTGNGYRFLGKAPLRTFDKWHLAISIGLIAWMFFGMK